MTYYLKDNLYPAPNAALHNADVLMNDIAKLQLNGSNYIGSGFIPMNGGYNYGCGYSSGFGGYTLPGSNTNITYNSNGYSYNNSPSALNYIDSIGGVAASIFGAIGASKANRAMNETQAQGQLLQYMAYEDQSQRMQQSQMIQQLFQFKMMNQMFGD